MAKKSVGRTNLKGWKSNNRVTLKCTDCGEPQNVHAEVAKIVCSRCVRLRLNPGAKFIDEMEPEEFKEFISTVKYSNHPDLRTPLEETED